MGGLYSSGVFFVPFFVKQDWGLVLRSLVTPHLQFDPAFLGTFGAFLGTNISVYLFFWESSTFVDDQQHKYGHLFNDPEAELPELIRSQDHAKGQCIRDGDRRKHYVFRRLGLW
jgi:hypothetical protein